MLLRKFQQLAQWVGFLAIAGLALYGLVNLGSGRLWAAGAESRTAATDAPQVTIPSTFNYQGFLRDAQGNPMGGTHKISLKLWKDVLATDVPALHSEDFPAVAVRDGLFNVVIGSLTVLDTNLFVNNVPLFVGVSVDDGAELLPRQRIHPVPWAILATTAQNAVNATNATNATTATTLVANASVSGLRLNDTTRFRPGGATVLYEENDNRLVFNGGSGFYFGGNAYFPNNVTVVGTINDEEQPLVYNFGALNNTTHWYDSPPIDIGTRCGDADGCTIKILLRRNSDDYIYTIAEQIYIEQPDKSGNKSPGLHGYARQLGGGDASFVLNTAGKYEVIP